MTITKYIWFYILVILTLFNTYYLYFGQGLGAVSWTGAYFKAIALGVISMLVVLLINMLVFISYLSSRALYKKNFLRVSLIILGVMFAISLILRIIQVIQGNFCFACWVNTLLYLAMFLLVFFMLKDLRKLIHKLFLKA